MVVRDFDANVFGGSSLRWQNRGCGEDFRTPGSWVLSANYAEARTFHATDHEVGSASNFAHQQSPGGGVGKGTSRSNGIDTRT